VDLAEQLQAPHLLMVQTDQLPLLLVLLQLAGEQVALNQMAQLGVQAEAEVTGRVEDIQAALRLVVKVLLEVMALVMILVVVAVEALAQSVRMVQVPKRAMEATD
jgi:hypothetical protein